MFFTPGRTIGLIVFVVIVLALGALLKLLDSRVEVASEGEEDLAPSAPPLPAKRKKSHPRRHH